MIPAFNFNSFQFFRITRFRDGGKDVRKCEKCRASFAICMLRKPKRNRKKPAFKMHFLILVPNGIRKYWLPISLRVVTLSGPVTQKLRFKKTITNYPDAQKTKTYQFLIGNPPKGWPTNGPTTITKSSFPKNLGWPPPPLNL